MTVKEIIKNKKELIRLKKAVIKSGDIISFDSETALKVSEALKGESFGTDTDTELFKTIVGNTYNWLDSHGDVHIEGIFTKSIKENGENVMHLHDHIQQLTAKVGTPLKVYEKSVTWQQVGLNKAGNTTALLMNTRIEKERNPAIFKDYKSGSIQQHSVGMQYMDMVLCVNDKEEKEEFAAWQKYSGRVANIEKAEEAGYFWAILQAKLIEISAVIKGSNELTPTFANQVKEGAQTFEALKGIVSEEIYILLLSALEKGEPLELAFTEIEPQNVKKENYLIQALKK